MSILSHFLGNAENAVKKAGSDVGGAVSRNRGAIGNALLDASPFLSLVPGVGVLGSLGAGALGRAITPGSNIGDILKSGASNAALGAGLQGGAGLLKNALSSGASSAGGAAGGLPGISTTPSSALSSIPGPTATALPGQAASAAAPSINFAGQAAQQAGPSALRSALSAAGSGAKGAAQWLGPGAVQGIAGAIGNAPKNAAEAQLLKAQADAAQYGLQRQQGSDAALANLRAQLAAQIGSAYSPQGIGTQRIGQGAPYLGRSAGSIG